MEWDNVILIGVVSENGK
ncbi:hypothetical protein [Enterobacter hormaechei]